MNTLQERAQFGRIANLVTLRDDLQVASRMLAGRANMLGFRMHAPEKMRAAVNAIEWFKSAFNPGDAVVKCLTSILEGMRDSKTASESKKELLAAAEDALFWGKVGFDVATLGIPVLSAMRLGSVAASLALKAAGDHSRSQEEALRFAMESYWSAAVRFQRLCPIVVAELDREIAGLR